MGKVMLLKQQDRYQAQYFAVLTVSTGGGKEDPGFIRPKGIWDNVGLNLRVRGRNPNDS
jgi:hypothetical protein|tara:strand:- start:236 stop:412 length:177 start_codon:yes stop_codon:yes gene_type:complete